MKIDRFWATQILIFVVLFALLIGSYLFSFGPFASNTRSRLSPVTVTNTDNTVQAPTTTAACTKDGSEPSPEAINGSLGSNDAARQKSCLEFLQTESKAGDKGAELWLGRAYHNGWGVEKSLTEAATHYGKAATAADAAIRDSARQWQLQLEQEQQESSR
jgi:hypothetical protein